jgi:hypothetical protein
MSVARGARGREAPFLVGGERRLQLAVIELAHAERANDLRAKQGHRFGVVLGSDRIHGRGDSFPALVGGLAPRVGARAIPPRTALARDDPTGWARGTLRAGAGHRHALAKRSAPGMARTSNDPSVVAAPSTA